MAVNFNGFEISVDNKSLKF